MELLVNPYTGDVYPEFGPNMMWNLKYGMHYGGSRDMMGRSMMNSSYYDNDFDFNDAYVSDNDLTLEDAYQKGRDYIISNFSDKIEISEEMHAFYGYCTLHLEEDGETIGMLSVNGFTGEVWFHNWHGELIEIIEGHN